MTTDTGNAVEQVTEQSTEQVRADMQAGFDEAITGTAPTETPAQTTDAATESTAEQTAEPPVVAEDPTFTVKKSDWEGLQKQLGELSSVKDEIRKVYGQYGGMKNFVEEKLKSLPTQTVSGVTRINPKALERLKSEYGDELAEIFTDFIESGQAESQPAGESKPAVAQPTGIDPAEFDRRVAEAEAKIKAEANQSVAIQLIDFRHPDRAEIREKPEFRAWRATLSVEDNEFLNDGWDVNVLSQKLDAFKSWNAKRLANVKRLEGAVTPKGVARAAPAMISDEQALKQGFDSVFQT